MLARDLLRHWPMAAPPLPCAPEPEGEWREEECFRVSGEVECPICGLLYWQHARVTDEAPSLARACDGRLLKL